MEPTEREDRMRLKMCSPALRIGRSAVDGSCWTESNPQTNAEAAYELLEENQRKFSDEGRGTTNALWR